MVTGVPKGKELIPVPELYPSERIKVTKVWAELNARYAKMTDNKHNIKKFTSEAVDRFITELGLLISIDFSPVRDPTTGQEYPCPVIQIEGRLVDETSHDFTKHSWETQHGLDDGVVGKITEDGRLVDPDKIL